LIRDPDRTLDGDSNGWRLASRSRPAVRRADQRRGQKGGEIYQLLSRDLKNRRKSRSEGESRTDLQPIIRMQPPTPPTSTPQPRIVPTSPSAIPVPVPVPVTERDPPSPPDRLVPINRLRIAPAPVASDRVHPRISPSTLLDVAFEIVVGVFGAGGGVGLASRFAHGCRVAGVSRGEGGLEVSSEGDVILNELGKSIRKYN
jgi:hypothetical protein